MTKDAETDSQPTSEEEILEQFERLKADVAEMTRLLTDLGLQKADGLRDEVKARAEKLSKSAAGVEAEVAAQVRDKPLQTLVIAGLIGFVLGLLSRRG